MAKLYCNRKTFDILYFGEFYFKRVKRITPVYFVIAIFLIFVLPYSILDIDYKLAVTDFKWATVFLTNLQDKLTNLDYFSIVSFPKIYKIMVVKALTIFALTLIV